MYLSTNIQTILLASGALTHAAILPRQANGTSYAVQTPHLDTDWTYKVGTNPWPEYPRPQLERSQWKNLNGIWRYQNASGTHAVDNPPFGQTLEREVLVPSCLESGLSGIQGSWMRYSWFSTTFDVPTDWTGERTHLNFGAVDYESWVYINGQYAGFNRGGYFHFTVDVTDHLSTNGTNELLVFVHDPTDSDDNVIPIGKQTLNPSHIFYRPCSGIWQSVWIESAPANHITELQLSAGADGTVNATVHTSNNGTADVEIKIFNADGSELAGCSGSSNTALTFKAKGAKLWTPDSPTLYNVSVTLGDDVINSYTAFRTVSRGEVNGIQRPLLNGEFVFQFGTLDQGYWPDGLYTPPNREAMEYDLKMLKDLGFNMLRKHIKVETALFYQSCDQLGLMLIQDMPSLRPSQSRTLDNCTVETILPNADQQQEFQRQLETLIRQHRSYPSIVIWVIYNEGWGQITDGEYPEFALADLVHSLDPTRLIDSTSGWFDHGAGDFQDNHHYANPQCGTPFYSIQSSPFDPSRIAIQGEFGGLGENTTIDHLWNVQQAIDTINQTYEIDQTNEAYNYRSHLLLTELGDQVEKYACSGGVWTQTTDVEGEVNGLLTYDRRVLRPNKDQWRADIQALYDAAAARSNGTISAGQGHGAKVM